MAESERKILCLGDSNTYGYWPDGLLSSRYKESVRWTGLLKNAGWRVYNRGVNGALVPSEHQFESFADMIEGASPLRFVTVMYGTNDVVSGKSAEDTGKQMERFIGAVKSSLGNARLVLIAPPPVKFGYWVPVQSVISESEKLAACYKNAAEKQGVLFCDAGSWGVGLAGDGVHFTEEGHRAFFEGLSEMIK